MTQPESGEIGFIDTGTVFEPINEETDFLAHRISDLFIANSGINDDKKLECSFNESTLFCAKQLSYEVLVNIKDLNSQESSKTLSEHSCSYCKINDSKFIAKCETCSRWFCNSLKGSLSSHLINHLSLNGHNTVSLHPHSPLSDRIICFICGRNNIFSLDIIASKFDSSFIILCRQSCASNFHEGSEFDLESRKPVVFNRQLNPLLCKTSSDIQEAQALKINLKQIKKLELSWKSDELCNFISDSRPKRDKIVLEPTQLSYTDPIDFRSKMAPFIMTEEKCEKISKAAQKIENISGFWSVDAEKTTTFWFSRPLSDGRFLLKKGDEVIIRHSNPTPNIHNWFAIGKISEIPQNMNADVPLEIKSEYKCYTSTVDGYSIEIFWKPVTFNRMLAALNVFIKDPKCMSPQLSDLILGKSTNNQDDRIPIFKPDCVSAPNLPLLNDSQAHAVRKALQRPLTLIQGPPGTGKTTTSATIVYHLAKEGPVLVVATSNVAVDQLAEKIHESGLRVIRVYSKTRELYQSTIPHLSLHEQAIQASNSTKLKKLHQLKASHYALKRSDEFKYSKLRKKADKTILDAAQVICCTCSGAGDLRVLNRKFLSVLIDEATQASEPQALIPIVHGARQVIMVGDHRQLGPFTISNSSLKAGYNRSMFERLMQNGIKPLLLQVQYRMHPSMSKFPSSVFYNGSLKNGVTDEERTFKNLNFPWPNKNVPMLFLSCYGPEEISPTVTSYMNREEASAVAKIVTKLIKSGITSSQIGIITPYQGQRALIHDTLYSNESLDKSVFEKIEVSSVDAFQGREKDFIIVSCVRSNDKSNIGFVSDVRRLNVSLTRARYGLIILGNPKTLASNPLWHNLLRKFRNLSVFMEGNLENLVPCSLQLPKIKSIQIN